MATHGKMAEISNFPKNPENFGPEQEFFLQTVFLKYQYLFLIQFPNSYLLYYNFLGCTVRENSLRAQAVFVLTRAATIDAVR